MKKFYFAAIGALFSSMLSGQTTTTFTVTSTIETFTVPACVTSMTIEARGAQGGYNTNSGPIMSGYGATMIGTFAVTPGQVLKILVGQQPSASGGNGGGGGSFVTDNSNNPLIVAGGGGGSGQSTDSPDKHGQVGTSGGTGAAGGGTGGSGGNGGGIGPSGFQSGAGGGLLTNGSDGWTTSTGGSAFVNGGAGGPTNAPANGGFGGGGSGSSYVVGGGGGGYSGGGSGGNSSAGVGGGGGSFNAGTSQSNTGGVNTGHGMVIFTYTTGPSMPTSVSGISMVCEGTTITITAAAVVGATSYNWSVPGSATIVSGQGTNVILLNVGTASGTASVTATDGCGISGPATFSYTVNPTPTITATSNASAVCAGSSATLSVTGATSYSWSSGGTDSTEVVSPGTPTTYTVIGTDSIGCADTTTVSVGVNALPVVNLGADTAECGPVTLDAQNFGSTYLWSTNAITQIITVSVSGTIDVAVMDINGCVGRDTINVTVNTPPVVVASAAMTTVCLDDASVALFGSPAGGMWTGAGINGNSFHPDTAGMGTHVLVYQYTDSVGCSGMDSVSVDVQLCTGMDYLSLGDFGVYPNPNNGTFTIALDKNVIELVIEITDVHGRIVYSSSEANVQNGFSKQISLENEASGIYFMRVIADGTPSTQKISVQK